MRRYSSALGAAAVGLASGREEDRAEMLRAVEHGFETRIRYASEASRIRLAQGGSAVHEHRIAEAWVRWYSEALDTLPCEGSPSLTTGVSAARGRLVAAGEALSAQIGE